MSFGGPGRRTDQESEVFRRLREFCGIDVELAGERLHKIKEESGRGGADNVVFDLSGNVFDPATGEWLGSLTAGGKRR